VTLIMFLNGVPLMHCVVELATHAADEVAAFDVLVEVDVDLDVELDLLKLELDEAALQT
jgi:hypothetical protein